MTFSEEDPRPQINFRVEDNLKQQIEEYAKLHDMTQSDVLRTAVRQFLPAQGDAPADPRLREAYLYLRHNADPHGRVHSIHALTELSQTLSMPKQLVKTSRLYPLEREGWIEPARTYLKIIK